ncbi:MAG TPA: hypothetical protein V6C88_11440 [Chroococcidiopsis sp.]
MSHDVRQWLAEIKALQQKLAEARQECDEAYRGASNWRKLYETEAQQRRTETHLAQQTIAGLKAELQRLQGGFSETDASEADIAAIQDNVAQLQTVDDLQKSLVQVLTERDRLQQQLKAEQLDHERTRKALTSALGDTVDLLSKERAQRNGAAESSSATPPANSATSGHPANIADGSAKTPSPGPPRLNQAESPV